MSQVQWSFNRREGEWTAQTLRGYVLAARRSRGRWFWYVFHRWSGESMPHLFGNGHARTAHNSKRIVASVFARARIPPSRHRPNHKWTGQFTAAAHEMGCPENASPAEWEAWLDESIPF